MMGPKGISRRQILTIAAGATGASIAGTAVIVGTSTPAQAAKVPQKAVKYQAGSRRASNAAIIARCLSPLRLQDC